jgi:hypothetical protein
MSTSGRPPAAICQVMKLTRSRRSRRWKYFVATVPAAQPKPDITAHSLGASSPCHCHGSTMNTSPASAQAMASHCAPRTRSSRTGQARSMVQNGIVNTRTDVRPAPPLTSAIVVPVKLIVVWKKPATITAAHDCGQSGRRSMTSTPNSSTSAAAIRCRL